MEKLKFKMQGFWYKLWLLIYENDYKGGKTPPENTCSYGWELIIASFVLLITLPITIYRIIYLWVVESFDIDAPILRGLGGQIVPTIFFIMFVVIGVFFIEPTAGITAYKWYYVLYGAGIFIVFVGITFGLMYIGEHLVNLVVKFFATINVKEEKPDGTIKILYKGWKDKHCSPIDWEE